MANKKSKITYSEPTSFFPKEIRDKYFGKSAKPAAKKTGSSKKTTKK